jgi:transcriptional regulator with XRE-family HTH domain
VISVEDWAEIRRLHVSERLSQAAIARRLGISRNMVAEALASQAPPRYRRTLVWDREAAIGGTGQPTVEAASAESTITRVRRPGWMRLRSTSVGSGPAAVTT